MIRLPPHRLPGATRWFPTGAPGLGALPEHVATTGIGGCWADRPGAPRAVAVSCADHVLLRGDPAAVTAASLAPFAHGYVQAPARFLPVLGAAFDRVTPWERMLYVHRKPVPAPRPPRGWTIRPLGRADTAALAALAPDMAWIHGSWGGPAGLAVSGRGWCAADRHGRLGAVACVRFTGGAYEDLAVVTAPEHRRERLGLACVTALCADVAARGRTPSWTCSRDNRPSRLLAWTAGFRLEREYVHHVTGHPAARPVPAAALPV